MASSPQAQPCACPRWLSCKLLDVSKLSDLGWSAFIPLDDGIAGAYDWFPEQHGAVPAPSPPTMRTPQPVHRFGSAPAVG
jgi:hypothetical protein